MTPIVDRSPSARRQLRWLVGQPASARGRGGALGKRSLSLERGRTAKPALLMALENAVPRTRLFGGAEGATGSERQVFASFAIQPPLRSGSAVSKRAREKLENAVLILGRVEAMEVDVGCSREHPKNLGFGCRVEEPLRLHEKSMTVLVPRDE